MKRLTIQRAEHGVVMCALGCGRIPGSEETVRAMGLREQHYGWPGITRTKEGDILVSASERVRHVDPFGREVVSRSTDAGRTWSEPQVIFNSVTDDRDHALNTLPDGTVVSTWFSSMAWTQQSCMRPEWKERLNRLTPDTLQALSRGWLRRSHDGGRTWEAEVYPTLIGQHAGPSALSNGDLIYCGPYSVEGRNRLVATRSTDGGCTWAIVGEIPGPRVRDEKTGRTFSQLGEIQERVVFSGPLEYLPGLGVVQRAVIRDLRRRHPQQLPLGIQARADEQAVPADLPQILGEVGDDRVVQVHRRAVLALGGQFVRLGHQGVDPEIVLHLGHIEEERLEGQLVRLVAVQPVAFNVVRHIGAVDFLERLAGRRRGRGWLAGGRPRGLGQRRRTNDHHRDKSQ